MKHLSLTLLLLLATSCLFGQNSTVDADSIALEDMRKQMESLFGQGNYKQAVEIAREMLAKAEQTFGKKNPYYGTCLDNMGVMLQHAGNLQEALPYLEAGVEHARTYLGTQHENYVSHLSNLGMLHMAMGDYGKALAILSEVVDNGKTVMGEENAVYGIFVNNLGLAYENIGQFEDALKYYQQALDITRRTVGKEDIRYASRLNNIGTAYRALKQYDKALLMFSEAMAITEKKLGKAHPRYISQASNTAKTYRLAGDLEKALVLAKEVEALAHQKYGPAHPEYLISLGDVGNVYFAMGRPLEAKAIFLKEDSLATEIYKNGRHWRWWSWLNLELALVHQATGDCDGATGYFSKLVDGFILETQRNFDLLNQKEQETYLKDWNDRFRKLLSFALRHPDRAVIAEDVFDMNLLLKGLTLGYRKRLLEAIAGNADEQTAATFGEWQKLHKELSKQYSLTEEKRVPDFKEKLQQADELERQLAVASSTFREARQLTHWREVQAALHAGEAAIEFCNFDYHAPESKHADSTMYVALLLREHDEFPQIVYLFEEKQLGNLEATRRLYAPTASNGNATLHDLVWKPLAGHLNGISTIYYSPAGLLNRVNISAIPVSADQTLSQRYRMHELGSTRQLVFRRKNEEQFALKNAVVYGGISYDAFPKAGQNDDQLASIQQNLFGAGNEGWVELEGTRQEAKAVQSLLGKAGAQVTLCEGYAASEEEFKQMGSEKSSPTIVHLATHGFFFPDRDDEAATGFGDAAEPMVRCGLALAGANEAWEGNQPPANREDGILTAYEIAHLNLRNTELVVLSACDTGLGELKGNEGVYGLQRAFKIAGAHYVLMSLWDVSDRQTQEFMTAFYKKWLEKKQSIPHAFQSAQNQMKEKYSKPSNPSLWAGFVLVE